MNVRRSIAILALSTVASIGFAQSGVPPASGNQNSASPDTSNSQTQQTGKHHRRHSRTTSPDTTTSPGTTNGTPPNSTTLPNTSPAPTPNTTPTTPTTPPQR